jgi:hypothetical protein
MGKLYLPLDSICWLWVFGKYLVVRDEVTLCVLILQSFEPPTWSLTELRVWDSTEADLSRVLWCVPRAKSKDNDVLTLDLLGWVGLLYQPELKSWHRFTETCYLFTSDEWFCSIFISTNTFFFYICLIHRFQSWHFNSSVCIAVKHNNTLLRLSYMEHCW